MIIELKLPINEYKIHVEGSQITATIVTQVQDPESANFGKIGEKDIGYYTKLPNAMQAIIREEVAANQSVVDLQGFLKIYKELSDNLTEQFNLVNI